MMIQPIDPNLNIVRDGLVLWLDARFQTSYPASGTTWYDLSGNGNNGTLVNGPTFDSGNGGSIVFDGNNDNIEFNSSIDVGTNFTACVWNKPSNAERRTLMANSYTYSTNNSSTNGFLFNIGSNGTELFLSLGKDLQYRISSTGYVSANTWFYACATFDGTDIKLYYNAEETTYSAQAGSIGSIAYSDDNLFIGGWKLGGNYLTTDFYGGNIPCAQLYNRVLTSTEILQNYNAQKVRFGL